MQYRRSPSIYDPHATVDVNLVQMDAYIVMQVDRFSPPDLVKGDREEIAQRIRIKLAYALPSSEIRNDLAYLSRVVHNECISFLRQRKMLSPFVTNAEGEPCQGRLLVSLSEGMDDPQVVFEQCSAFTETLERAVEAILALPPRQKLAMVCLLREKINDPSLLIEAFKRHGLDITEIRWPVSKDARQRLQASCRPARLKIARDMNINLSEYRWLCPPKQCVELSLPKQSGAARIHGGQAIDSSANV